MSGLWRKELRSMLPFLSLAVVIPGLGMAYELFAGFPNMKPWAQTYQDYVVSPEAGSMVISLFVLALASGLLVREHDEGTMEFLDSLPVSRTRVFAVKITMAMLVILLLTVLDASTTLVLQALSRTSVDGSFHLKFWLTAVAMRLSQAFVLLSLGAACSFLRRFGWLLMGVLVWAYLFVHEVVPGVAVLNVFALADPQLEGEEWIIPRRLLLVQLSLGAVLMSMAYILFLGWGDVLMRAFRKLARSRVGNGFLLSGSLAVGIIGISLFYQVMKDQADSDEGGDPGEVTIEYPSWSTSRARSRHYEFIYPTNMTGRALTLLAEADPVFGKVQQFFEAEEGEPVVVDATSTLPRHAGLAYWEKIRLNLAASEERSMLQSVLGHETAHVFLERLSDSRLSEQFNSTRLFHEGVATYAEYALFPAGRDVAESRRVAAVMRDRDEVHIEELVDNSLLVARRDSNLVYPLGELFVAELANRHGQAAIGKIARALAREDAPEGLAGLELWRDVFQACGYNFERVLDGFYQRLDQEVERHRQFIDHVPRPRAAVESDEDFVRVRVIWKAAEGWQTVCRFRRQEDDPERFYFGGVPEEKDTFLAWRGDFPDAEVWYQVGVSHADGTTICEPWARIQVME